MMKKGFCIALVAILMFSLTACGVRKITAKDFDVYKNGKLYESFEDVKIKYGEEPMYFYAIFDEYETVRGIQEGDTIKDFLRLYGNNRAIIYVHYDSALLESNGDYYTPASFMKEYGPFDGECVEFAFLYAFCGGEYKTLDDFQNKDGTPQPKSGDIITTISFIFDGDDIIDLISIEMREY